MSEDMNQNNQQPTQPEAPQQPAAPQAPAQPAAPQQPPAPTSAPVVSVPPQGASQQPSEQQLANSQQSKVEKPKVTFRENGKYSFWATDEDPDSDSKPMSWGFKIGWFMLGFVGGMLGLVMAWLSTSTLSKKRRSQAVMATWFGFACQAVLFLVIVLTGGTFPPFMPGGGATSATTATTSTSAFG